MSDETSYAKAGVNVDATDAAKREMARRIDRGDPRVLNRLGAFASLVEGRFEGYEHPILVLKTEEPGSKQKLAVQHGRVQSVGYDLINHLVNDVAVMGAEPLYVLDCIVCAKMDPEVVTALVASMAEACEQVGCVLVGGETSVQPGVMAEDIHVLSATAVGIVEKSRIIDGSSIAAGDIVLAVASNGLHTNGYTLVRALLERNPGLASRDVDGTPLLDVIMRPHRCYLDALRGVFGLSGLKGLAHVTGGGIGDNLKRILPPTVDAAIDLDELRVLPVFRVIRDEGNVPEEDMLRTFNLGVGLLVVCAADAVDEISGRLSSQERDCYPIGRIDGGTGAVNFRGHVQW